ncbi:MAG: hypothetical protein AAFV47_11460 [Pseudomonadota bacterium]
MPSPERKPSWLPVAGCAALFVASAAGLVLGGETTLMQNWLGVPAGQWLTIAGMVSGAAAGFFASTSGSVTRLLSLVALMLAIGWLPLGTAMSGNVYLNFTDRAVSSAWFWRYTYFAGGAAVLLLLISPLILWRSRSVASI